MKLNIFSADTFSTHNFHEEPTKEIHKKLMAGTIKNRDSRPSCISVYNTAPRKVATLHYGVLRAIDSLVNTIGGVMTEDTNGIKAFGINDKIYTAEAEFIDGKEKVKMLGIYNRESGNFNYYSEVNGTQSISSKEPERKCFFVLLYLAMYADMEKGNEELKTAISDYYGVHMFDASPTSLGYEDIDKLYLMSDNVYRRITSGDIPINEGALLSKEEILSWEPENVEFGNFTFFQESIETKPTTGLDELTKKYSLGVTAPKEYENMIPNIEKNYIANEKIITILDSICFGGARKFMFRGPAGCGKTTDTKAIANVLKLPRFIFTCSERTDEMELVSAMLPDTSEAEVNTDIISAFEKNLGRKANGFEEGLIKALVPLVSNSGNQKFKLVNSSIVEAAQMPSILEIQEPACISKPGTLVKLNSLLDDDAKITLINGDVINLNPNTIIIFTTNVDYRGCREFNESVLSRMDLIIDYDNPTTAQMIDRARKEVGKALTTKEVKDLRVMAETILSIQNYINTEGISGGVCGMREYLSWVRMYRVSGKKLESCKYTVVSKVSSDLDIREEIFNNCIKTKIKD